MTRSHPRLGRINEPIEVVRYQVVVEELESEAILSVDLPPDTTVFQAPESFTQLGQMFKFEILVKEDSGNQTAVESFYVVVDE